VEPELLAVVCRAAARTAGAWGASVEVVVDPLAASLWVHLPSPAAFTTAVAAALRARGLDAAAVNDHRLHLFGWSVRLLRWRLGALLAAVDDLSTAEDLTTDLVCYHHDRQVVPGQTWRGGQCSPTSKPPSAPRPRSRPPLRGWRTSTPSSSSPPTPARNVNG